MYVKFCVTLASRTNLHTKLSYNLLVADMSVNLLKNCPSRPKNALFLKQNILPKGDGALNLYCQEFGLHISRHFAVGALSL